MPYSNKEKQREYYRVNKEKIAEYYQLNKEKKAEYNRKWNEENKEKKVECDRRYREENKEKIREQNIDKRKKQYVQDTQAVKVCNAELLNDQSLTLLRETQRNIISQAE